MLSHAEEFAVVVHARSGLKGKGLQADVRVRWALFASISNGSSVG